MFRRLHNNDMYEESISIVMPERSNKSRCTGSQVKTAWAVVATLLCLIFIIALAMVVQRTVNAPNPCLPIPCSNQQTEAKTTTTIATKPTTTPNSTGGSSTDPPTVPPTDPPTTTFTPAPNVYSSREWTIATGLILSQMDTTAEPCEDFYQYACGGFINNAFLPPDRSSFSRFSELGKKNEEVQQRGLTKSSNTLHSVKSTALKKLKSFYYQCNNMTQIQNHGLAPLKQVLFDVGKWDLFMNESLVKLPDDWNFTKELTDLYQYESMPLFSISVAVDDKNSSLYALNYHSNGLSLPSMKSYSSLSKETLKSAFLRYSGEVLRLFGWENPTTAEAKMNDIYEFEERLAEIYVPKEDWRDVSKSYVKLPISNLMVNFTDTIDLEVVTRDLMGLEGNDALECITYVKSYFDQLPALLTEYLADESKKKILNDYITWRFIHSTVSYLGPNFQYAQLELYRATDGVEALPERWVDCVRQADSLMERVTGALFIEADTGHTEMKDQVTEIVEGVRSTLNSRFETQYEWMDDATKQAAMKKLEATRQYLVYPDYLTNTTSIDSWYEDLTIDGKSYFQTKLNGVHWHYQQNLAKFGTTPDPTIWEMSIPSVNAYYDPSFNSINIPSGILRRPFFSSDWPGAWNYGGIGSVIGHEISHAFDDVGSEFDKDGNLNASLWTNQSFANFMDLAECIVDQYASYTAAGQSLNSNLTKGEDIADNGGLSLAHEAYTKANGTSNSMIPALNITEEQLFFVSYSQTWCAVQTPEALSKSIQQNAHSPAEFRVRGPLSNFEPFATAFGCTAKSTYNPTKRCTVW